jgi:hypothetical protein
MEVEPKFLRLFKPAALGDRIDGWRVCWVGGWDKCRVVYVVMVRGNDRPVLAETLGDALPITWPPERENFTAASRESTEPRCAPFCASPETGVILRECRRRLERWTR